MNCSPKSLFINYVTQLGWKGLCYAKTLSLKTAAVSCSLNAPRLGGVRLGLGLTGKPGRAWIH